MWIKLNIEGAEIFTPFGKAWYEAGFNKVVVKNEKEVYIERKCSFDIRLGIYGSYEEANKICNDIIRAVQEGKEEFEMPKSNWRDIKYGNIMEYNNRSWRFRRMD